MKITGYGQLDGWRPLRMDMPLVRQESCCCCGNPLQVVAALCDATHTIHVGGCGQCGYVGYMDRPERSWFDAFYTSDWDDKHRAQTDALVQHYRVHGYTAHAHPFATVLGNVPVKRGAKALEFGCGLGWTMCCNKLLYDWDVTGLEACEHRVRVSRDGFGLNVHKCGIEDHHGGPYDVIYSSEVLEHTYDPAAVIAACSQMQTLGGWIALSVPDFRHEPTMGVLCFLPHLHSFTRASLDVLFARHGYETHNLPPMKGASRSLHVMACKVSRGPILSPPNQPPDPAAKLHAGMYPAQEPSRRFGWTRGRDASGYVRESATDADLAAVQGLRVVHVEQCERRTAAPVEIQWDELSLFVK